MRLFERSSPPVEHKTGDDEHCRHRQHLRECFRGRPLCGFLHAVLPRPGRDSSLRERANDGWNSTRNTPRRVFALTSPHSANIDRARLEQYYGGILAHPQPVCAGVMTFFSDWQRLKSARVLAGSPFLGNLPCLQQVDAAPVARLSNEKIGKAKKRLQEKL